MAGKTINPTRMELTRLKAKQKTALRATSSSRTSGTAS